MLFLVARTLETFVQHLHNEKQTKRPPSPHYSPARLCRASAGIHSARTHDPPMKNWRRCTTPTLNHVREKMSSVFSRLAICFNSVSQPVCPVQSSPASLCKSQGPSWASAKWTASRSVAASAAARSVRDSRHLWRQQSPASQSSARTWDLPETPAKMAKLPEKPFKVVKYHENSSEVQKQGTLCGKKQGNQARWTRTDCEDPPTYSPRVFQTKRSEWVQQLRPPGSFSSRLDP